MRLNAYFAIPLAGGAPTDISTFGLTLRPMIEAVLGTAAGCQAPGNLQVTNVTATGSTVTFNAAGGAQGYTVIYGPAGFTPGAGSLTQTGAGTSITLSGLTSSTAYDVYVHTNCAGGMSSTNTGPVSFTTTCVAPAPVSTFPHTFNFDTPAATQQLQCGISVVDANNDGFSWVQLNQDSLAAAGFPLPAHSAPNFMAYIFNQASAADDWFFLPALQVPAGQQLRASWWQAATAAGGTIFPERVEVKWGTAATVAAMTHLIYPSTLINDTIYAQATSQPIATTGTVYVGFHCLSAADEYVLRIDDVTFDALTGVKSDVLARAVGVYPNPTSGVVNVSVTETGATRVALRVLDNLGRVVYTGSMSDNAIKGVDLSHLSNGLYTVQVTLDDQVVTKQVSVRK